MATSASKPSHHVDQPGWFGPLFQSPWDTWKEPGFSSAWKMMQERRQDNFPETGRLTGVRQPTEEDFSRVFPLTPVNYDALRAPPPSAIQALWVGHATVLLQMCGLSFITDPVFSKRCSPSQLFGPARVVAPAYEIEDTKIPDLDFVLLSHNHYDHLDYGSVKRLHKRQGDALRWYVPLGMKAWFTSAGLTNVVELDWWQEVQHESPSGNKVTITMTPAQHWSARGVLDRRRTLWGGYAVKGQAPGGQELRFWFTGDTGYCPVFTEIGDRLGPFDLSAIPIGAYEPRWFMKPQHINAEEAVDVHREVRSKRSISIHCCTFCLTNEDMDEPPRVLEARLAEEKLPGDVFVTLRHGAMIASADGEDVYQPNVMKW